MRIYYDSGKDEFRIDRSTDAFLVPWSYASPHDLAQIAKLEASDISLHLANHAHRNPDRWWTLDQVPEAPDQPERLAP